MENQNKRKRLLGTLLIIVSSIFLSIIAIALIASIFMDDLPIMHFPDLAGGFAFAYFGIRLLVYGKRLRRKNKKGESEELAGIVEVRVDIKEFEFIRLSYTLIYSNAFVFVFSVFALTALIEVAGYDLEELEENLFLLILGIAGVFLFPTMVFIQTRKQYRSNSQLHEVVNFTFDEDHFELVGRSFAKEYDWANLMRIKTTKKFIILFTSGREGFFIPIRCLQTEKQKQFLAAIQSIAE